MRAPSLWTILVLAILQLGASAHAQTLRESYPNQARVYPVAAPEPRSPIEIDPVVLFQYLIGSSDGNRRIAFNQLGWNKEKAYTDTAILVGNARFYRVNLDDDDEMEAIMSLSLGIGAGDDTRLLIFKKWERSWWQIGAFSLCCTPRPNDAERMLELRNIIDWNDKDILIRLAGGGSDIQESVQLGIYRIFQGQLYRTFMTREEFAVRRSFGLGPMLIEDERHQIIYPKESQGKDAYIVDRTTKSWIPEVKWRWYQGRAKLIVARLTGGMSKRTPSRPIHRLRHGFAKHSKSQNVLNSGGDSRTHKNCRILSQTDVVGGETVTYAHDTLRTGIAELRTAAGFSDQVRTMETPIMP